MANIKSSIKRIAVAERNHDQNRRRKSEIKTAIKKFEKAIEAKDLETAEVQMKIAEKKLRQAEQKNIIHKNKVNRRVGQITRAYNEARA